MNKKLLVYISDNQFTKLFWETVVEFGFDVFLSGDKDELEEQIRSESYDYLLIKSKSSKEYVDLIEQFKQKNLLSVVRFFTAEEELLFGNFDDELQIDLLKDNFNLVKTILSGEVATSKKQRSEIAYLTEQICQSMYLSKEKTVVALAAAHVHDLSAYLVNTESPLFQKSDFIRITMEFLKPFNYSPVVLQVLKQMYMKLEDIHDNTYSIISQIVTVVSIYCQCKFKKKKYLNTEFSILKEYLSSQTKAFAEPFILGNLLEIVSKDIVKHITEGERCTVTLFAQDDGKYDDVIESLEQNGFSVFRTELFEELIEFKQTGKMEILVIAGESTAVDTVDLVNDILETGLDLITLPSYLISESVSVYQLSGLYQKGLEDIIDVSTETETFMIKMLRSKQRILESPLRQIKILNSTGTFGTLSSMSLIDLLQTMRGSGKQNLVSVTSEKHQLSIYVDNGIILHAECDEKTGVEQIYAALKWQEGVWCIESIAKDQMPSNEINKPIDMILLEGCHQLDESAIGIHK
ncbi:MAG: DUF4388 domain-containing protein [Calditrichaeota bacterium]|nr:MAG: DUF4388 domain-containing protein [Calditrichota bacterium]